MTPFYQVVFNYLEPQGGPAFSGVRLGSVGDHGDGGGARAPRAAKFDLTFTLGGEESLGGAVEYNTDLYDHPTTPQKRAAAGRAAPQEWHAAAVVEPTGAAATTARLAGWLSSSARISFLNSLMPRPRFLPASAICSCQRPSSRQETAS